MREGGQAVKKWKAGDTAFLLVRGKLRYVTIVDASEPGVVGITYEGLDPDEVVRVSRGRLSS